ncbi:MAG: hypothetical protein M1814_001869 [Vezdaea aestivalis]|nr:MAG: hypothetical protein M1814_001869 [Vezdaea aestivalis]
MIRLVTPLLFVNPALSFSKFSPNCTSPPEHVNYASSPSLRGTINIIWTCAAVLIICTWTIQHLSVPLHEEKPGISWNQSFLEKVRFNRHKLWWMTITLVAPEFIMGKAVAEKFAAHYSQKQFKHKGWTTTHAYFANMRGFILKFDVAAVKKSLKPAKPTELGRFLQVPQDHGETPYYEQDVERSKEIERGHCIEICQGQTKDHVEDDTTDIRLKTSYTATLTNRPDQGTPIELSSPADTLVTPPENAHTNSDEDEKSSVSQDHENPQSPKTSATSLPPKHTPIPRPTLCKHKVWTGTWPLNAEQLYYAYQTGIISDIPSVTAEELSDRSKGDGLVKGLAILQILWLAVQIIARSFQNLAITLLELTVLAFALTAIIIYITYWHKPQEVKVPTYIRAASLLTREQVIGLAARSPVSSMVASEIWLHGVAIRTMKDTVFPNSPGIAVKLPWRSKPQYINAGLTGVGMGGAIFGAVHFVAWQFHFPTPVERLLWRISCFVATALPWLGSGGYWFGQHLAKRWGTRDEKVNKALRPLWLIIVPCYLLARMFLLVEVCRSLAYLPPSAFQSVEWSNFIPHVS